MPPHSITIHQSGATF